MSCEIRDISLQSFETASNMTKKNSKPRISIGMPTSALQSFQYLRKIRPLISSDTVTFIRTTSLFLSIIVFFSGAIVLIGWIGNIDLLKSLLLSLPAMKTNTAICFVLLGIALALSSFTMRYRFIRYLQWFFACIASVIAGLTIAEYAFSIDLGIDNLLFIHRVFEVSELPLSNRMASNTAALLFLISTSVLFLNTKVRKRWISHYLLFLVSFILLPTVIGYIYGMNFIYGKDTNTAMPIHTTVGILLLLLASLFARPQNGFMAIVTSNSSGGFLSRRLLLTAIVLPPLMGWIILYANRIGLFDTEFRFLFLITSSTVLFTFMIWRSSRSLYRIDGERHMFEQNLLFLTESGKILASSLDYRKTLKDIAQLAISQIADACTIDLLTEKKEVRPLVIVHADKKYVQLLHEIRKLAPPDLNAPYGIGHVLRTGKAKVYPVVSSSLLKNLSGSMKEEELFRALGMTSLMIIPITASDKILGSIQFISTNPNRHFTETDVFIAHELASRAGLAMEGENLYKKAREATRLRDEFISIVSHELKTPITSLKMYVQILRRQVKFDPKATSYVSRVEAQVQRLTVLIGDLLDVSRIQVGKLAFHIEDFSIDEMVEEVIENIQLTTQQKIILDGRAGYQVRGDRDRIGQVLTNLLTNAVKYSSASKKIIVSIEKTEKNVTISVQDFGPGIEKANLDRIFDRFYQVKDPHQIASQGLGMGLYISREIMRRHGSDLLVKSKIGEGSTFRFSLPLAL